jgi:aspartate/methionine/tyrosine aminotransferase
MLLMNDLLGVNNPYLTDQISSVAFQHLPKIAAWSKALLQQNRQTAYQALAGCPHLLLEPLQVGTVLFPKLEIPVEPFCRLLRDRYDTIITPGRFFGAPDHIRLALGGDPAIVQEGYSRVRQALTNHSN